jgi:hypothetical protein
MSNEIQVQTKEMAAPPASLIEACMKMPPRDMVKVRENLIDLACSIPEVAAGCIYCTPVGRDDKTGLQKFAMGESVRLAEIAQTAFGRIFHDADVPEFDTRTKTVSCKARIMDLTTLNIYTGTAVIPYYSEKRLKVSSAACSSFAKRNAIQAFVKPYTQAILEEIKKAIVKTLDSEGRTKEAFESLSQQYKDEYGVTTEQLKKAAAGESNNVDKIVLLRGILNAIRDGALEVKDVFEAAEADKGAAAAGLAQAGKKTEAAPETTTEPAQGNVFDRTSPAGTKGAK